MKGKERKKVRVIPNTCVCLCEIYIHLEGPALVICPSETEWNKVEASLGYPSMFRLPTENLMFFSVTYIPSRLPLLAFSDGSNHHA